MNLISKQKTNLYCLFAARKGSKRIKNKNFLKINNKPIIYYPINKAKNSKIFKDIFITTDSVKIKKYVQKLGVKAPFLRKKCFSGDYVQLPEVIKDFFKRTKNFKFKKNDIFVFIYSTNIFLNIDDLKKAIKKFKKGNYNFLIGVEKFNVNPMKSFIIKNDNLKPAFIKNYLKRTQNIENYYFHPASFFIFKINVFEKKFKFPNKTGFYLHSKYQNIDIDDKEDLNFAIKIFNS